MPHENIILKAAIKGNAETVLPFLFPGCLFIGYNWKNYSRGGIAMVPQDLAGLRRIYLGFIASRVVITANNLGVFDCLKKPGTAAEAAKRLKADQRAIGDIARCSDWHRAGAQEQGWRVPEYRGK